MEIYSKQNTDLLLHVIYSIQNDHKNRCDLTHENEFLQVAVLRPDKGRQFDAHKHLYKDSDNTNIMTQESIIVISGRVLVSLFDIDDSLLLKHTLSSGDCLVTLYGGHSFEILDNETVIYEHKTGPYDKNDKKLI